MLLLDFVKCDVMQKGDEMREGHKSLYNRQFF